MSSVGWTAGEVSRLVSDFIYLSLCYSSEGQPTAIPFPSVPLRTVRATFKAHGSPVPGLIWVSAIGITPTSTLMFRQTCPPLPCTGLSPAQTTMGAPSPWGSRPLGDLEFLRN